MASWLNPFQYDEEEKKKKGTAITPKFTSDWKTIGGGTTTNYYNSENYHPDTFQSPIIEMPKPIVAASSARKLLNTRSMTEDVALPSSFQGTVNTNTVPIPKTMPNSNVEYWERGMARTASNQNKPADNNFGKDILDFGSNLVGGAIKGAGSIMNTAGKLGKTALIGVMPTLNIYDKLTNNTISNLAQQGAYATRDTLNNAGDRFTTNNENRSEFYNQTMGVAQSMGQMIPQIATTMLTGVPTPVIMGVTNASDEYDSNIKKGMSNSEAALRAVVSGVIEGGSEYIGGGKDIKNLLTGNWKALLNQTGEEVAESAIKKTLGQKSWDWFKEQIVKEAAQEAGTEVAHQVADATINFGYGKGFDNDPNKTLLDNAIDIGWAAYGGAAMGGLVSGAGKVVRTATMVNAPGIGIAEVVGKTNNTTIIKDEAGQISEVNDAFLKNAAVQQMQVPVQNPAIQEVAAVNEMQPQRMSDEQLTQAKEQLQTIENSMQAHPERIQKRKWDVKAEALRNQIGQEESLRAQESVNNMEASKAEYEAGNIEAKDYLHTLAQENSRIDIPVENEAINTENAGVNAQNTVTMPQANTEEITASEASSIPTAPKTQNTSISDELMSREGQATWNKIAETVKKDNPNAKLELVRAKSGFQKHISKIMKTQFGTEVVFYKGDSNVNGFVDPRVTNTIFIKAANDRNEMMQTTGHEFLHIISKRHNSDYSSLLEFGQKYFGEEAIAQYQEGFKDNPTLYAKHKADPNLSIEEMLADELGNNFTNHSFWENLYQHSKELFEKLVKIAKGMIDEINKYGSHSAKNTAEWKTVTYVGQETSRVLSKEFEKTIASVRQQVAEGKVDTEAKIADSLYDRKDGEIRRKYNGDALTPLEDIIKFALKKEMWNADQSTPEFGSVNNRMLKELEVSERLFGKIPDSYTANMPGKLEGSTRPLVRTITPSSLGKFIYDMIQSGEGKFLMEAPIEEIVAKRGVTGKDAKLLRDDLKSIRGQQPILSDNGKAGKSIDFLLGTCHPTRPCKECYAASAYIRMSAVRKAMRNTIRVYMDPFKFGREAAKEVKKVDKFKLPFVRLLGSGDLTSDEQVDAFNTLAENLDRPIHIFSRHHDMMGRLISRPNAPFIKMGSIDIQLYEVYGVDYLADNLKNRGIANVFLYTSPTEFEALKSLKDRDAVKLILSASHELHDTLDKDKEIQASSCPCDAGERSYMHSCVQCAMSDMGCFMSFSTMGVDQNGKVWDFMDEESPEDLTPIAVFGSEAESRSKAYAKVAVAVMKKSVELINLYERAFKKGERSTIPLKDIRFNGEDSVSYVDNIEAAEWYKGKLKEMINAAAKGSFYLPGGEIQPEVYFEKGRRVSDSKKIETAKANSRIILAPHIKPTAINAEAVNDELENETKYSAGKKKKEVVKSEVISKAVNILRSKGTVAGNELADALEAGDTTYAAKLPQDIGKVIGGKRYVHVSAESELSPGDTAKLQAAKAALADSQHKNFSYDLLVIGQKDNYVSFKSVPDFNDVSEPTLYEAVTFNKGKLKYENGKKKDKETGGEKYQIYHQKATMVSPNYSGFDVEAERKRIEEWKNSGIPEAKVDSRIGWSNYWKEKILDVMKEPNWEDKVADRVAKIYESYLGSKEDISKLRPWGDVQQKVTSEDTSINDKKFPKTITSEPFIEAVKETLKRLGSLKIADIGGGRFDNVKQFLEKGLLDPLVDPKLKKKYKEALDPINKDYRDKIQFLIYDKFNRSKAHNDKVTPAIKDGQSDIVTVNNVLNVIDEPAARAQVIINAADAVKPEGVVLILPYVGNQSGLGDYTQEEGSWQTNRVAASYVPEVKRYFDDVSVKDGIIVARKPKKAVLTGEEDIKYSVKSDKFKAWFKDSKVVDENGNPMVVYHGTRSSDEFTVFNTTKNADEPGTHFGTRDAARNFVDPDYSRATGDRVYPVYLSIQKPLETPDLYGDIEEVFYGIRYMVDEGKLKQTPKWEDVISARRLYKQFRGQNTSVNQRMVESIRDYLKDLGYDGLKYENNMEDVGSTSWVAFNPNQIKSAIGNNGEYASDNPDVRYSTGQKEKEVQPTFYSKLQQTIQKKMANAASPSAIMNLLRNNGVKEEEIAWSGIEDFLEDKDKISKAELMDFLKTDELYMREIVKDDITEDPDYMYDAVARSIKSRLEYNDEVNREVYRLIDKWAKERTDQAEYELKMALLFKSSVDFQDVWEDVADSGDGVKYKEYASKGGKNYREMLITIPNQANGIYQSDHWDEEDVVAHTRLQDYTDHRGNKILRIEEIQSDWHQDGRRQGYRESGAREKLDEQVWDLRKRIKAYDIDIDVAYAKGDKELGARLDDEKFELAKQLRKIREEIEILQEQVPDAPFKKTWPELVFKRVLREAVEKGYDKIQWVGGKEQADRYKLTNRVSEIILIKSNKKEEYMLEAWNGRNKLFAENHYKESQVRNTIGDELTNKLLDKIAVSKPDVSGYRTANIGGVELEVGGEGMKGFYDKILPDFVKKYVKKWGAEVTRTPEGRWELPVTEAMKEEVLYKGQTLYSAKKNNKELKPEEYDSVTPKKVWSESYNEVGRNLESYRKKMSETGKLVKTKDAADAEATIFVLRQQASGKGLIEADKLHTEIARIGELIDSYHSQRGHSVSNGMMLKMLGADSMVKYLRNKINSTRTEEQDSKLIEAMNKVDSILNDSDTEEEARENISKYMKNAFKGGMTKAQQSWIDSMIDSVYSGEMEDDELKSAFAAKWKIPSFTDKNAAVIIATAGKLDGLEKGTDEYNILANELNDYMNSLKNHSFWEHYGAWEHMMMLSAPKSAIRNITGNLARIKDYYLEEFGKALMDMAQTNIRKALGQKDAQRSTLMPKPLKIITGLGQGAFKEVRDVITGKDTSDVEDSRDFASYIKYKNPFGRIIQGYVKLLMTDRPFKQVVLDDHMARAEKLAKKYGIEFNKVEAMQIANQVADETFFNGSDELIDWVQKARRDLNALPANLYMHHFKGDKEYRSPGHYGLGNWVLAFAKVPYNVSKFAVEREYHLAAGKIILRTIHTGFAKAKKESGGYIDKDKNFDTKAFINDISKFGNGLLTMFIGSWLYQMGLVHIRPDDDDKDKKLLRLDQLLGHNKFQLNLSAMRRFFFEGKRVKQQELPTDNYATLDWFVPTSILLIAGIKGQQLNEKKVKDAGDQHTAWYTKLVSDAVNKMQGLFEGTLEQVNGVVEMPMFATVQRLAAAKDPTEFLATLVLDIPGRMIPAPLKYVKDSTDNTQRDTTGATTKDKWLNGLKLKLPVVEKSLPAKVDMFGNDVKSYPTGNGIFNVWFNPAAMSKGTTDPDVLKMKQVYDRYGMKAQIPPEPERTFTISNKDYPQITEKEQSIILTPQEFHDFSVEYGKRVKEALKDFDFIDNNEDMQEKEVNKISEAYSKAKAEAKKMILSKRGLYYHGIMPNI